MSTSHTNLSDPQDAKEEMWDAGEGGAFSHHFPPFCPSRTISRHFALLAPFPAILPFSHHFSPF
jgi:hypothetical protein